MCATLPIFLAVDFWDAGIKSLAALAVILAPTCLFLLTQRANRAQGAKLERTEVEKLFIGGTSDLMRHLQNGIKERDATIGKLKEGMDALRGELHEANRTADLFRSSYRALLELIQKAGLPVPDDLRLP